MSPNESKGVHLNPTNCVQVSPSWPTWVQVSSSESKWVQMHPSEAKWIQVSPSETNWDQAGTSGDKSETKWTPPPPPQSSYPTSAGLIRMLFRGNVILKQTNSTWHSNYFKYTRSNQTEWIQILCALCTLLSPLFSVPFGVSWSGSPATEARSTLFGISSWCHSP